jgi:hypothetical protein
MIDVFENGVYTRFKSPSVIQNSSWFTNWFGGCPGIFRQTEPNIGHLARVDEPVVISSHVLRESNEDILTDADGNINQQKHSALLFNDLNVFNHIHTSHWWPSSLFLTAWNAMNIKDSWNNQPVRSVSIMSCAQSLRPPWLRIERCTCLGK